jgi:hypothetical protein
MFNFFMRILLDNVGGRLMVQDGALLPPRCAVCNCPVQSPPLRKRFTSSEVGSERGKIIVYLHLCRRHASRGVFVGSISAAVLIACGAVALTAKEGVPPTTFQFVAFIGLIISALFVVNSLFFDPFFRGLSLRGRTMEVKGFGKRFRQSLQPDEIRIIDDTEYATMQR